MLLPPENTRACSRDFQTATASMARQRHFASGARGLSRFLSFPTDTRQAFIPAFVSPDGHRTGGSAFCPLRPKKGRRHPGLCLFLPSLLGEGSGERQSKFLPPLLFADEVSVGGDTAFEFGAAEDAVALIVGLGRARLAHTGATGLDRRGLSGSAVVFHKELFTSKSYIGPGKGKTKKNRKPQSDCYFRFISCGALPGEDYTLISTSTPQGNSSFIRASTVLALEL